MTFLRIIRNIIGFLLALITAVLLVASPVVNYAQNNLLDEEKIKSDLKGSGFYEEVTGKVQEEAFKAYKKSDYYNADIEKKVKNLLEDSVEVKAVKKEAEDLIDKVFDGEKIDLDLDYLADDFSAKAEDFMKKNNIPKEKLDIKALLKNVTDSLKNNIDTEKISDQIADARVQIVERNSIYYWLFYGAIAAGIIMILVISARRFGQLAFAFIFSGILLVAASFALGYLVDVSELKIPLDSINNLLNDYKNDISKVVALSGAVKLAIGIVFAILAGILGFVRREREYQDYINSTKTAG